MLKKPETDVRRNKDKECVYFRVLTFLVFMTICHVEDMIVI